MDTLGGNNSMEAIQQLLLERPDVESSLKWAVDVYKPMPVMLAKRLARKQNQATEFTHSITTQDKVGYLNCIYCVNSDTAVQLPVSSNEIILQ